MLTRIIEKLRKKEQTNVPLVDCYFILKDDTYIYAILDEFGDDEFYWLNYTLLFTSCLRSIVPAIQFGKKDEYRKYFHYAVKYLPLKSILDSEINFLSILREYLYDNYKDGEELLDFFWKRFDPTVQPKNFIYNSQIIKFLLKFDKYDYIKNIQTIDSFSQELSNLLLNKFPFDTLGIPAFIKNILNGKFSYKTDYSSNCTYYKCLFYIEEYDLLHIIRIIGIEKLSTSLLIRILGTNYGQKTYEDGDLKNTIIEEVFGRLIRNPKLCTEIYENGDYKILNSAKLNIAFYLRSHADISKKLIDNHIYLFASFALLFGFITLDEIYDYVADNIQDKDVYTSFLCMLNENDPDFIYGESIVINRNLVIKLIENGKLDTLTKWVFPKFNVSNLRYYLNEVVTHIRKGNPLYDEDINNLEREIIRYPLILVEILNTKKIYNFSFLKGVKLSDSLLGKLLYNYMINYPGNLIVPEHADTPLILEVLIKRKMYTELIECLSNILPLSFKEISSEGKAALSEIIKSDHLKLKSIFSTRNKYNVGLLNREVLAIVLEYNYIDVRELLEYVNHHNASLDFYTVSTCLFYKDYVIKEYGIKEENYLYFIHNISPYILRYLDNTNIIRLLNIDIELLKRICGLFQTDAYSIHDVEAVYDSIKQYDFAVENSMIINAFSNIINYLEDDSENQNARTLIHYYIKNISSVLTSDFMKNLKTNYPCLEIKANIKETLLEILKKISRGNDPTTYKNILHEITDFYIKKEREKYRKKYHMSYDIEIPFSYDTNSLKRVAIGAVFGYGYFLNIDGRQLPFSEFLEEYLVQNGFPSGYADKFLNDYRYSNRDTLNESTYNKIKRLARKFIEEHYSEIMENDDFREEVIDWYGKSSIKRIYMVSNNDEMLCEIFGSLDIDCIINNAINKENIYNLLKKVLAKYKFHIMPNYVLEFINNNEGKSRWQGFYMSAAVIANFLSFYTSKYNQGSITTLPKVIQLVITSSLNLEYYSNILGSVASILISNNPGPNAATGKLNGNIRLKEAVTWTIKNYKRNSVSIPTFNDVLFAKNKSMRIIVGNFTHPSNITHGERTGSCMRIGGVGESLFNFVLDNENGFHIRFEDPDTHEYISRVSGFRNGNTVFLNELRFSLNKNRFSNDEIIEFCKLSAERIIEMSKNSSYPIENVVIHNGYAFSNSCLPITDLGVSNIKAGLPYFYTDVNREAIVLATSSTENKFIPLKLGITDLPLYMPARENVIFSTSYDEISELVNRVHSIGILLHNNLPYYEIKSVLPENGFVKGYANMDWYAYVDSGGRIHSESLNVDKRANLEMEEAIEKLKCKKLFK